MNKVKKCTDNLDTSIFHKQQKKYTNFDCLCIYIDPNTHRFPKENNKGKCGLKLQISKQNCHISIRELNINLTLLQLITTIIMFNVSIITLHGNESWIKFIRTPKEKIEMGVKGESREIKEKKEHKNTNTKPYRWQDILLDKYKSLN